MTTRMTVPLASALGLLSLLMSAGAGEPKKETPKDTPAVAAERKKIVGMWTMSRPGEDKVLWVLHFHEDGFCSVLNSNFQLSWRNKYSLDPTTNPKQLDHPDSAGRAMPGIYELDGDTIKLCTGFGQRPTEFKDGNNIHLFTLKRVTKKPDEKGK